MTVVMIIVFMIYCIRQDLNKSGKIFLTIHICVLIILTVLVYTIITNYTPTKLIILIIITTLMLIFDMYLIIYYY